MLEILTDDEREIMYLLIQGHNFNGISAFMCINYTAYKKLKKSMLKKLHISRISEILAVILQQKETL